MRAVAKRALSGGVLLGALVASAPANANGKFPAADQFVVDPSNPTHLVARTTFGMLVSRDAGVGWDWICEGAVGYQDIEPPIAVVDGGAMIVGFFGGVRTSTPNGCGWSPTMSGRVEDVSVSRSDPTVAYALAIDEGETRVWRSTDRGLSFAPTGTPLPAGFIGLTLDEAPSDPARLYLSGVMNDAGMLARSDDGGATWALTGIDGATMTQRPFIGAIDPGDADVVHVRLSDTIGGLRITKDGGTTWSAPQLAFDEGPLWGLAVSPDGSALLVGGERDGLHRVDVATLAAEKVSNVAIRCLAWTGAGVYACVNEVENCDGFTLGVSHDEGVTFDPLMPLAQLRGPVPCDAGEPSHDVCTPQWPAVAQQLAKPLCGTGGSGGAGGAGGGGGATVPVEAPPTRGGCGCVVNASERTTAVGWWALGLLALRRRRARPRKP